MEAPDCSNAVFGVVKLDRQHHFPSAACVRPEAIWMCHTFHVHMYTVNTRTYQRGQESVEPS